MQPTTMRTLAAAVITAVMVTGLAACTPADSGSAASAPESVAPSSFTHQHLAWEKCASYARTDADAVAFKSDRYECAYLRVPLDYDHPDGRQAQIGVLRLPATGHKVGSLLVNPGGPGSSGMSFATTLDATIAKTNPIRQKFDLIGFDPRGVASSVPSIDCFSDAERDADAASTSLSVLSGSREWTAQQTAALPEQCADRSGGVDVIEHMGTHEAVRDLDVLRAALGDSKLTYLGISYGTRLGAVYAQTFPKRVRALVLDGAVDPTLTTKQRLVSEFGGFQHAFDALAIACAAKGAQCPLGTDPAQATKRYQEIMQPLVEHPLPTASGRDLTFEDAELGTIVALYNPASWTLIEKGIAQVQAGRGDLLLALSGSYQQRNTDGTYGNENEALMVYNCLDEQRQTPAQETALKQATIEAAPITDPGKPFTSRSACEHWPVRTTLHLPNDQKVSEIPPTLEVGVTQDPATPYSADVHLSKVLGGRLFPVKGIQHGASFIAKNDCVDGVVTNYLVNLKMPARSKTCSLSK